MNKIILKDTRPTKDITLPSYPDSVVTIWPSLLVSDAMSVTKTGDDVQVGIESLVRLIKSWNFTSEDGKDLDVSLENIKKLEMKDLEFLMKEVTAFALDVKKN